MKVKPTKKQLDFLDWEFGLFFHFGIRSFFEGHRDWDMKTMPLEDFNPIELDCEQWVKTAKDAGAKYAVLVTKHHDGFANWPSKYTKYSVAYTPWKDGNGDIVREYVDACRKYGLKVGLYYSPAEFELKTNNKSSKDYDDYFINQISELLTQYGKIDYLWFDGCGSEDHEYDQTRIVDVIRTLQPEILVFNMWDPDTRWVGNEAGIAPMPCFNMVNNLNFSILEYKEQAMHEHKFLPAECDFRMRLDNWFYSEMDEDTVKSLDELMGLYYYSVGRGANFFINIGPDRRGLLPEKDTERILEFGRELERRFSAPLFVQMKPQAQENTFVINMDTPTKINHIVMMEDLTEGESVKRFKIRIKPYSFGEYITVYEGHNIGHKAICKFHTIATNEILIQITDNDGAYSLKEIKGFYIQ